MDMKALEVYLTDETADTTLIPAAIGANGNCLPRSVSLALFRTESMHLELRISMALEMTVNENLYLENEFLSRGPTDRSKDWVLTYSQFVDGFVPGKGKEAIRQMYRFA